MRTASLKHDLFLLFCFFKDTTLTKPSFWGSVTFVLPKNHLKVVMWADYEDYTRKLKMRILINIICYLWFTFYKHTLR